jgi:hypothetical protein
MPALSLPGDRCGAACRAACRRHLATSKRRRARLALGCRIRVEVRRFRRAYVEIGKGNGKSPMAAGIGHYMHSAYGKVRAEVYSAATDQDQAAILFRDAVAMYERSPALRKRS